MNSLRGDQIGTLLTLATDPLAALMFRPVAGDTVKVKDEEGDIYDATVDTVDDIWMGVTIDWDSRVSVDELIYGESRFEGFIEVKLPTGDDLVPAA
jgi:hypothetical protein